MMMKRELKHVCCLFVLGNVIAGNRARVTWVVTLCVRFLCPGNTFPG